MATCPECGQRVPFGGGRTVKNAHLMMQLERVLLERVPEAQVTTDADEESVRRFCAQGHNLAETLHNYGHKWSMVNPDWQSAGEWTRVAQGLVHGLTEAGSSTPSEGAQARTQTTSSGDLRSRFAEPWRVGELEAENTFEMLMERSPSRVEQRDIKPLVEMLLPEAMERMNADLRTAVSGPTAFPDEMFEAMREGCVSRLTELLTDQAGRDAVPAEEGGWIPELRQGLSMESVRAANPTAWKFGEETAIKHASMEIFAEVVAEAGDRNGLYYVIDTFLDPQGGANMAWAASDLAEDTYRAFSLGYGSKLLELSEF